METGASFSAPPFWILCFSTFHLLRALYTRCRWTSALSDRMRCICANERWIALNIPSVDWILEMPRARSAPPLLLLLMLRLMLCIEDTSSLDVISRILLAAVTLHSVISSSSIIPDTTTLDAPTWRAQLTRVVRTFVVVSSLKFSKIFYSPRGSRRHSMTQ